MGRICVHVKLIRKATRLSITFVSVQFERRRRGTYVMYSVGACHLGVVLANQQGSSNLPVSQKRRPPSMKMKHMHVIKGRPAELGAFSLTSSSLQCCHGGGDKFVLRAQQENSSRPDKIPNCFGAVVDDAMLAKAKPDMPITQENRAWLAMGCIDDDDKKGQAFRYVAALKDKYGNDGASTLCLVYNATGDTLRYAASNNLFDDSGLFSQEEGYYPPAEIGNGQWAAFLHVHKASSGESSTGAVVYRGKNKRGQDRDFLLAWDTPWTQTDKKVYCKIGAVSFYEGRWSDIYKSLSNSNYMCTDKDLADGVEVEAITERGDTSPKLIAKIRYRK
ncbi:hypothetical protein BS78_05G255100 [Paspalum vaginatum]|uniref:23 kDa jasmonate-induced protein-like n=1 Tax=Paspalum vaginatum TaxID=158149 RepID=A0A9W8CEM5_9POAL|nr:hypothetical protein BS78_K341100 [Paspalum vaginatum]KAJ1276940.1 hypothetical protein BS78_05G255100 [Paspalum vaginatum]